jgi:hypothetical protein
MREAVRAKKDPVALAGVRFERFVEGSSAQIMHVGPFSEEGPAIARIHDFIEESGRERTGKPAALARVVRSTPEPLAEAADRDVRDDEDAVEGDAVHVGQLCPEVLMGREARIATSFFARKSIRPLASEPSCFLGRWSDGGGSSRWAGGGEVCLSRRPLATGAA